MNKIGAVLLALSVSLVLATSASAAAPVAKTTGVNQISPSGATLVGSVDPNGEATTYYFEYGTTRRYGSRTPDATVNGANARRVTGRVEGLAPNTRYHFRLVAGNRSGVNSGADRTFRTKPQPLGLQITATPNPITLGTATTVLGTLTGTGNAGKQVVLQQRPFPFTAEFTNVGSPVVTDGNGAFSVPVLPLFLTTQFQVQTVDKPVVTSPVLTVAVAARVRTATSARSVRRNRRVRIFGTVQPARVGLPFEIQKQLKSGSWVVVARGVTRRGTADSSRYSKRVRVFRTARYRVFVATPGGDVVSGFGPEYVVRAKRG
jgi:hypothetical protein